MKYLSLLLVSVLCLNFTLSAQLIDSSTLQRRLAVLSSIWKVKIEVTSFKDKKYISKNEFNVIVNPATALVGQRVSDENLEKIAMVLAECNIANGNLDSVALDVYNNDKAQLQKSVEYSFKFIYSKYIDIDVRIKSLFDLCLIPYKYFRRKNIVYGTFNAPSDLYATPNDYGLITLVYSVLITKCLDSQSRNIQAVNITWTDSEDHSHSQTYSARDSTYLSMEGAF